MFTEAIIVENLSINTCKIRVPLFETVGQGDKVILTGKICMPPGTICTFTKNDKVWITFENNEVNKPIIIGQLYTEAEQEEAKKKIKTDIVDPAIKSISTQIDTKISSAITTAANKAMTSLKTELAKNVNEINCANLKVSSGGELPGSLKIKSTTKTGNYGEITDSGEVYNEYLKDETTLKEIIDTINRLVYALYGSGGIPNSAVRTPNSDLINRQTDLIKTIMALGNAMDSLEGWGITKRWREKWTR